MLEENLRTRAGVYPVELVRLIWGPLNTGFTVTHLHFLPQLSLQRQWPSTLQLAPSAGRVINRGCVYSSLPRCVVSLEVRTGVGIVACSHTYPP